ncbi:helix-turn-helix transcriptional regulator, partial [Patescibacteria group bacterium]|nr:helix-turn-helix transcriptional regulator [Patescibacteria group bacterium]
KKSFITKLRKDKEFQKLYDIEKKKLDIAIALSKARARKGLTQKEVAKRAQVTWETISAIENGRANSNIETLSKIFAAVGKKLNLQIS